MPPFIIRLGFYGRSPAKRRSQTGVPMLHVSFPGPNVLFQRHATARTGWFFRHRKSKGVPLACFARSLLKPRDLIEEVVATHNTVYSAGRTRGPVNLRARRTRGKLLVGIHQDPRPSNRSTSDWEDLTPAPRSKRLVLMRCLQSRRAGATMRDRHNFGGNRHNRRGSSRACQKSSGP